MGSNFSGDMTGYAAIKMEKGNLQTILDSVAYVDNGRARLMDAFLKYPYKKDTGQLYWIGGNFLGNNYGDFSGRILTQAELDKRFEYPPPPKSNYRNRPKAQGEWFVARLKE